MVVSTRGRIVRGGGFVRGVVRRVDVGGADRLVTRPGARCYRLFDDPYDGHV